MAGTRLITVDGRWCVDCVVIDRGAGPEKLYRVREYGCLRGYAATLDDLDVIGVPIADLVDPPAVPYPPAAPMPARGRATA